MEEFRIPLMTALVQGPAEAPVQPGEVGVDLSVSYFSGGGAGRLPVKLRGEIRPRTVTFRGYDEYTFTGERLKEGTRKFSPEDELGIDEEAMPGRGKPRRLPTQELRLDDAGAARTKFVKLPKIDTPKSLHAELEYRDPNGEVQTAAADIPLASSKRAVGLKPDSWAASAEALRYRVVVLDRAGNPVADSEVSVDLYQRKTYSHRRRIAGGFYSYENLTEIKRIALPCTAKSDDAGMAVCEAGPHCKGKTDASGTLLCEAPSPVSGGIILQAEVKDEDGNAALANFNLWVAGKDEWWFEARNDDRIDVIPEKKRYEPGEKARLQVRMPFREATALVTVEREGIVDVFVQKLSGKSPVVEIPVKRNYAPNAFVSVLAVRGRTADAAPTATFDPAKPAFKLGIGEIRVGWKAHELAVEVIPDRSVYRVRQEADVTFKVRRADGQKLPEGTELAVAAVDRGLLALRPNGSWRLLESMMRQRPYEIFTSTAQMMVIGKRHFGLKALPQGGGGGKQITRELFDTLLLWKAAVPLDDKGEARLKIPLKDSLTEYRIVAVATGGADLFGTGQSDVRTTQDLMLLCGHRAARPRGGFPEGGRHAAQHDSEAHERGGKARRCGRDGENRLRNPSRRPLAGRGEGDRLGHPDSCRRRQARLRDLRAGARREDLGPCQGLPEGGPGRSRPDLAGHPCAGSRQGRVPRGAPRRGHRRERRDRGAAAAADRRRTCRRARVHVALPLRLPRAEDLEGRGPEGQGALAGADARAAGLPRRRGAAEVLPPDADREATCSPPTCSPLPTRRRSRSRPPSGTRCRRG